MPGNGFSIALFPKIFSYRSLDDQIESSGDSDRIKHIFYCLKTSDFEEVMRKLTEALYVASAYPKSESWVEVCKKDLEMLKITLIECIAKSHPEHPSEITEAQYNYCYDFLKHFEKGKKYTFNYDLILYWVHMHFLDHVNKKLNHDDGFRRPTYDAETVEWRIGTEASQSVYYLHGSLHIFNSCAAIEKYTWIDNDKSIKKQVEESIEKSKYPLFVSEGTAEQKLSRIRNNSYLGRGFSSLKSISGNLFIFGHSLRGEDDHIFDLINQYSKVTNIFISLFDSVDSESNKAIIAKVAGWRDQYRKKEYCFYSAESANVWGKNSM